MSWKSSTGLKVLENNVKDIPPSEKINFITNPRSTGVEQIVTPNPTTYIVVDFLAMQDITTENVEMLQETAGSFDFLKDKEEKKYKPTDGDPV